MSLKKYFSNIFRNKNIEKKHIALERNIKKNLTLMIHRVARVKFGYILRVPDQNGIAQACYIVKIYHSDPEPLVYGLMQPTVWLFVNTKSKREREASSLFT